MAEKFKEKSKKNIAKLAAASCIDGKVPFDVAAVAVIGTCVPWWGAGVQHFEGKTKLPTMSLTPLQSDAEPKS